jgi:DNA-directed RNA polymerase subunit RPC12/RpoP
VDAAGPARQEILIGVDALDGNAIAGWLFEYFGSEMTTVVGRCKHCGTRSLIAELAVYTRAPGAVARCRACGNVVMMLVKIRDTTELHGEAFELPHVHPKRR